jgi:2'-5' RNA ligase
MAADRTQLVGAAALEEGADTEVRDLHPEVQGASGGGSHVRAFFGLPVPEAQRTAMAVFLTACAAAAPQFRWTPAANLHLTIRFIGSVDRPAVEAIADRLAARPLIAFNLELGSLGTFGHGRHVRVVWQGLRAGAESVLALAAQVDVDCVAAGLMGEKRPFQAHLTLARARARDGAELASPPEPPRLSPWRATELVLFASRLSRAGAVYEPLRALKLD